jgi:hypothetical protein
MTGTRREPRGFGVGDKQEQAQADGWAGGKFMTRLLLLAGAAMCVSSMAHASIIPILQSVTPDGSDFLYTYTATLSGDQGLTDGSTLVIQDFAGYVPGSISAAGSGFSSFIATSAPLVANFNPAAGGVQTNAIYPDNAAIPDLVFTYTGPNFRTTGGGPGVYPDIQIDGLTAVSTFGPTTTVGGFSSRAIKNDGPAPTQGTPAFNNGQVSVPLAAGVPEPASWALLIVGFGGVGSLLRRRRVAGGAV